jgi:hypothetical protein
VKLKRVGLYAHPRFKKMLMTVSIYIYLDAKSESVSPLKTSTRGSATLSNWHGW